MFLTFERCILTDGVKTSRNSQQCSLYKYIQICNFNFEKRSQHDLYIE